MEEQVALIYKGEALINSPKKTFLKASKGLMNNLSNEKKFIDICDEYFNLKNLPYKVIEHASLGEFSAPANPRKSLLPGKMKSGGHGQENLDFLSEIGRKYKIEYTYKNGVRIGAVDGHDKKFKMLHEEKLITGQSWFPEKWTREKIKKAGNFVIENNFEEFKKLEDGKTIFDNFEGIRVGVMKTTGKPATIFPDNAKQPIPNSKKTEINPFKE